jgi:hypothetical protein
MLLGRPSLKDAKVAHDWGNNTITIEGNGTIRTIIVTKHWEVKQEVLLCYDYHNGNINEEENHFCYRNKIIFNRNNQFT